MKWVPYNSYQYHSAEDLHNLATDFLFALQKVNNPPCFENKSRTCVSAGPGYLRLDFRSHAVQSNVVGDIPNIEGVIDEIWSRISHVEAPLPRLVNMLINLKYETDQLLEGLAGCAALNADDLMKLSLDVSNDMLARTP